MKKITIKNFKKKLNKVYKRNKKKFNIYSSFKTAMNDDIIIGYWSNHEKTKDNWGDSINPFIFGKLSGKRIVHINSIYNFRNKPVYTAVGSILDNSRLKKNRRLVIWGSGFKNEKSTFQVKNVKIFAVRGPLTRNKLLNSGYECPEVYGDPALLFPLFYPKKPKIKYKLGIIPHYIDSNNPNIENFESETDVVIIDITGGITEVIDLVLSCEVIASSSLHGLILADAYNIPSIWIKFSDKISGGNFKYHDYFLSVGRMNEMPLIINNTTTRSEILSHLNDYSINFNKENLLNSCPFFCKENI